MFTAEEWVKNAQNEAKVEANLYAKTSKALGVAEHKNKDLTAKLIAEEREQKCAEAGLKNAQDQVEEQRKRLHYAEIELATPKQQNLGLKANLEKAKEVAEASEQASYDRGV